METKTLTKLSGTRQRRNWRKRRRGGIGLVRLVPMPIDIVRLKKVSLSKRMRRN